MRYNLRLFVALLATIALSACGVAATPDGDASDAGNTPDVSRSDGGSNDAATDAPGDTSNVTDAGRDVAADAPATMPDVPTDVPRWDRCLDRDGDGFYWGFDCAPPGMTFADADCNDYDPNVHPRAREYCDSVDSDCDGFDERTRFGSDVHNECATTRPAGFDGCSRWGAPGSCRYRSTDALPDFPSPQCWAPCTRDNGGRIEVVNVCWRRGELPRLCPLP